MRFRKHDRGLKKKTIVTLSKKEGSKSKNNIYNKEWEVFAGLEMTLRIQWDKK